MLFFFSTIDELANKAIEIGTIELTILNFLILVSAIIGYSTFSFNHKVNAETTQMFLDSKTSQKNIVSEQMIVELPSTVQKWLLNSGMVGKAIIKSVFLEQDLQLLMKPEQKAWSTTKAKQYFTIEPPAFNWLVSLKKVRKSTEDLVTVVE